ncbi:MAG: hypothetical protein ACE5MK_07930 [Acidobacteriota bacterium]
MRHSWKVYIVASIVLVVSLVAAWTLPTTEILRGIIGLPGVGALFAALYQIVRDQAAHERALELQEKQQLFNLGVASHMANVAFDKHVQFSEQYISKMQQGLTELFQKGPTGESLKFCSDLIDARLSFRAWITEDLEVKLMPFEDALREIGARNIALEGLSPGKERTRVIDEMYQVFSNVLGLKHEGEVDERVAPRRIISHLQELLGVQQLTRLRMAPIRAAIDALEKKS